MVNEALVSLKGPGRGFIPRLFDISALIVLFFLALIVVPKISIYTNIVVLFSLFFIVCFILLAAIPTKIYALLSFLTSKLPVSAGLKDRIDSILDNFFGGFYGFFWWVPTVVNESTDGFLYDHIPFAP